MVTACLWMRSRLDSGVAGSAVTWASSVLAGQVVQLDGVLQQAALLAVPRHHVDDVRGVHQTAKLVHEARGAAAVRHEGAQQQVKLPALEHELAHAGHEEVVPLAALHLPQEVEVLQRLLGVRALEVLHVEHQQPRDVEPPAAASVPGLDVGGLAQQPRLEEDQGDVGGVGGEILPGPEQEVDGGLELSREEQYLEVEHRLGAGREVRLSCNMRFR